MNDSEESICRLMIHRLLCCRFLHHSRDLDRPMVCGWEEELHRSTRQPRRLTKWGGRRYGSDDVGGPRLELEYVQGWPRHEVESMAGPSRFRGLSVKSGYGANVSSRKLGRYYKYQDS